MPNHPNDVLIMSMKNLKSSIKEKLTEKYTNEDIIQSPNRSTDINVLLNRVKLDHKNEAKKKFYFFTATSIGLTLFGLIIFS